MRVFVTGGSGYIGTATIAALRRHGHAVTALARSARAAEAVRAAGAEPVAGGLADLGVLRGAAAAADAVIHLAQADGADADLDAATALQDGVGPGTYLHTGGTWVYGDTGGVVGEDAPWRPPALVAWRRAVEDSVLARADRGGRPVVIRPGLLYGGANRLIEEYFARPARRTGAVPYLGAGANHWALVHVEDLAELYVAALDAKPGAAYVGVDGVNPTAREVAVALSRGLGLGGRTVPVPLDEARRTMGPIADAFALDQRLTPARATAELGWRPTRTDPLAILARGIVAA